MKSISEGNQGASSIQNHHLNESELNLVKVDEILKDLIPDFMTRRFQEMEELSQLQKSRDFKALAHYGHKLKGSSLNYGFTYLGQMAQQLEAAAQSENSDEITELVQKIHEHIKNVQIVYVEEP